MKKTRWLAFLTLMLFLLFAILTSCQTEPRSELQKCQTCNGTGKVSNSERVPLPFHIVAFKIVDAGIFNPDYYATVTLENKGDEDGTFIIYADFNYKGIGTHTEQADLFVKAHSTASKEIRYDADKRYDDAKCRVRAPEVIHTSESICPVCKGKGLVAN